MYPIPTILQVVAVLSLTAAGHENVIRVPLKRKSLITRLSDDSRDFASPVDNCFLKNHVAYVKMKYCDTLAAFQVNTGYPHPLAQAIAAFGLETWGSCQSVNDVQASLPPRYQHQEKDITKRDGIPLSEVNSDMWMGTISVGTPPQDFTVDFDTGSADLILPDQACDSSCDKHARYNPSASLTSIDLDKPFQMIYNGGSGVNGTQYVDNVFMGGYEAVNQTLGAATTYAGMDITAFPPDGLLGMAFSQISAFSASPVFQTMIATGVVQQEVFGFALSSQPGQSEVTIGGTNMDMYQEATIEYVNVSFPAYWQIPFAGLTRPGLNNTPDVIVVSKSSYAQSIIDTGTSLIITSDSNAQAFYANVTGATETGGGLWSVPCSIVGSLAPTLTFGSRNFTVSASTFNFGPVSQGSADCIGGIAGGGSPYWIIGDVFLQNVYTIFDVANTRIGFADLA